MFRNMMIGKLSIQREFARGIAMKGDVHLSNRRVMRKIKLGKARPAIFHQFETLVELSDGSVIKRRSQAPKDEIRMINDQRNSVLWNPNRSDLVAVDPNATGKVNKFNQRFASFSPSIEATSETSETNSTQKDGLIELLGQNVKEVASGGKLFDKKQSKSKK
ncbi:54S ribosomal protein L36, mitochondrial [Yamadazyma tenuis]|uniref:Ribosomal protein bL31m N-terminal domain-containing protein n=1 Tax=Candida tenuis (strain ATCC 10573 / BCRC 21748 / CBS 615 / JCM 9827 / NBRC 10315 / NRRL Y-1498 / VKM Y-70) TaxID=590646 RepID=G3B5T0_CANTC|nr:uncharacterized protein CANTEDRAFT_114594 [Yamadazyma tenuis ATCC 10573]XP_006687417.1 uncharacterized protein CANTEDRAFT_114594 [Yamadazyma tenuis ATCC 10573]EGV63623.1 hypothetical protein CANTEDRAFT_114594 [Yamadazyma tenuis ATCC 10573]EGV63624.1 hypothetical protein CANTEDRAFT_114594 [Yamadazyma tenuis ATCC 10573]WEJ96885.1 54S ribosomal protein L36, mitochondrial [Yamadazyma tenuis]